MNITVEDEFLYVHLKADNSYETSKRFWAELYDSCTKHNRKRILVVSESEPIGTMAGYDHHKLIKDTGFTFRYCVAWVEKNPEAFEITKFIEDVLANRIIIQAKLFLHESEARVWLLAQGSA